MDTWLEADDVGISPPEDDPPGDSSGRPAGLRLARAIREGTHPAPEVTPGRIVINAADRRVVYEIGRWLAGIDCYEAAWPQHSTAALAA